MKFASHTLLVFLLTILCTLPAGAAEKPLVLFDLGHRQHFLIEHKGALDLSDLAQAYRAAGCNVNTLLQPITPALLEQTSVLIISGAFAPLAADEIAAVLAFIERGGTLVTMLHIAPPLATLLDPLGIRNSNGVIREENGIIDGNPLFFSVKNLDKHPLFTGLDSFAVYGGWALLNADSRSRVVARTGSQAWVDLNGDKQKGAGDAVQALGVVVLGERGAGKFVVFGDDAIFQNQFLTGNNLKLAQNLAKWSRP